MPGALSPQTSDQSAGTVTLGLLGALYELPMFRFHGAVVGFVD